MSKERSEAAEPAISPDAQAQIGQKLREMYEHVAQQPVPDRFMDLLSQLESTLLPASPGKEQRS